MNSLRQINLNSLRITESAARLGNFSRAAEENLITASAVSQRIKNLEAQLEFRVFHRRHNSVVLTQRGEEFISHVREALDTILAAGLESNHRKWEKVLRISVLPTFAVRWLLPRLGTFNTAHPEISLHISQSYKAVDFNCEDVDLAVRYGNGNFPGLESHLLFHEDLTPTCRPALLERVLASRSITDLGPRDLGKLTLLNSDTCHLNWRSWFRFMEAPDIVRKAASMSFNTCMLSFEAANAGLGVAIANRAYIASDIKAGRLVAPFQIQCPNQNGWYVVYPGRNARKEKVSQFRDWIQIEAVAACEEMHRLFFGEC